MKNLWLKISLSGLYLRNVLKGLIVFLICQLLYHNPLSAQNSALSFDGSNDYVGFSTIPACNSTMTIEAWIKIVIPSGYAIAEPNIVSWGGSSNSVEFRIGRSGDNAYLQFGMDATGSSGGAWQSIGGSTNLNTGNWVHVAVVKNESTSTLYVNGVSEATGTVNRSPALDAFTIGNLNEWSAQQPRYCPGKIDEVRIWSTARTQAEIQANLADELAGTETGLVHYYKMTNGSGTSLTDNVSSGGISGTLNNGVAWASGFPQIVTGTGTSGDPYQITSADELNSIHSYLLTGTCFKLISDINLTTFLADGGAGFTEWGASGWMPIGNATTKFRGNFDGNGKIISNLMINRGSTDYIGLFGWAAGSTINGLGLTDVSVTGHDIVGGLAGEADGSGSGAGSTVSNCYVTGNVTGNSIIGGLMGQIGSYAVPNAGTVSQCYSTATINGAGNSAGLLAQNNSGTISKCYATGNVTIGASNWTVGGLVAWMPTGNVINCYAKGTVKGDNRPGGLVGSSQGTVANCYALGSVIPVSAFGSEKGPLTSDGAATNSFWNSEVWTSTPASAYYGTAKTTVQMQTQSTYTDAGWDFTTTPVWQISASYNGGYPYLAWQTGCVTPSVGGTAKW